MRKVKKNSIERSLIINAAEEEEKQKSEKHLKDFNEDEKKMIKLLADIFVKHLNEFSGEQ